MNTWVVFRGATPAGDIKGLEGKSVTRWLGDSGPRGVMSPMVTQPNEATAPSPPPLFFPTNMYFRPMKEMFHVKHGGLTSFHLSDAMKGDYVIRISLMGKVRDLYSRCLLLSDD